MTAVLAASRFPRSSSKRCAAASRLVVALAALLCCLFLTSCVRREDGGLAPGNKAPPFTLPRLEGGELSLDELKGKVVLLNFWASWCAPCIEELPALQRLHTMLADEGFSVVSIAIDDTAPALQRLRDQFSLSFPVLLDRDGRIEGRYRVAGVPESLILDADHRVAMVLDPANNEPTTRMRGARDWSGANAVARIRALLPPRVSPSPAPSSE